MIIYLNADAIIRINSQTVKAHGGNFVPPKNLLNENGLYYVVEAVEATVFGQAAYPTIADKAAVYCHGIISNHIFQDGNKRTGLVVAIAFLKLNEYRIEVPESYRSGSLEFDSLIKQFVFDFTMEVASGKHTLDSVRAWFEQHTSER